jgi:hypothetical protein
MRAKAEEAAQRMILIQEMKKKYRVEINPRELVMFTPNEQQTTETTSNDETSND